MAQEIQQRLQPATADALRHVNDAILLHWQLKLAQDQPVQPPAATVQTKAK